MVNSKRRIGKLSIVGQTYVWMYSNESITTLIKHFGRDIKQLELTWGSLPENIIDLLNLMPKLEKILLTKTNAEQKIDVDQNLLQLPKLKRIESSGYDHTIFNIFKRLTPGVLHSADMTVWGEDEIASSFKVFENQHNIQELKVDLRLVNCLNFNQMKLTSLTLSSPYGNMDLCRKLEAIVNAQPGLKVLKFYPSDGDLKIICNGMKYLEELKFSCDYLRDVPCEFAELLKLKHLRKLTISTKSPFPTNAVDENLRFLVNESLRELDLEHNCTAYKQLSEQTVTQLESNLPKLKRLELSHSTIDIMNSIMLHYARLKKLRGPRITYKRKRKNLIDIEFIDLKARFIFLGDIADLKNATCLGRKRT